ncbi:uncharacterized protein TM35_000044130 [Trypanosoma theileri]|uniref:Uncharacterized protein n=1 Tax=Trypanosoma theileri TaxID=67003 RepID=A0A1X0P6J4_9TRYP|nr:uncharacterized protein TM35_000044130 [Trypanosoma theileri]ORC92199.1 hypothetical protein TM35_000044130 [Trypanosoma theileri]
MNLIPFYRSILKGIHAAKDSPHHLKDIRFILSYPSIEDVQSSCNIYNVKRKMMKKKKENSNEEKESQQQETMDPNHIVRICCEDLRRVFLPDPCIPKSALLTSSILSPAAQRFIHMRELLWIKERLEDIGRYHKERENVEEVGVHAEKDPNVLEFLDDEVFSRENRSPGGNGKHLRRENEKNEDGDILALHEDIISPPDTANNDNNVNNNVNNDYDDPNNTEKDSNLMDEKINKFYREIPTIGDLHGLGEPVLRIRTSPFHLTKQYLNSFGLNPQTLTEVITSTEKLTQFLQQHIPRRVTCQNENITLTATVRPFDITLGKWCDGKRRDPFEQARRTFILQFSLTPNNPSYVVEMVDAYLLRLDVRSSQLIEEFSHRDSSRLFWMMNEQSLEKNPTNTTSSTSKSNDLEEVAGSKDNNNNNNNNNDSGISKRYELTISNPSSNPTVMKGQLYYVLRMKDDNDKDEMGLHKLPIFNISFGHLLFSNDD